MGQIDYSPALAYSFLFGLLSVGAFKCLLSMIGICEQVLGQRARSRSELHQAIKGTSQVQKLRLVASLEKGVDFGQTGRERIASSGRLPPV